MNEPAPRLRSTLAGLLYGGLGGVMLAELGLIEILPQLPGSILLLVGMLVGGVFGALGRKAWVATADAALIVVYLIIALTPVMDIIAPRLVRRDPLAQADAAISLSASVLANGALNTPGADRLLTAAELIQRGWAPRLVTTRVVARVARRTVTSDSGQREMVALAGVRVPWTIVGGAHTTHDEAVRSAAELRPIGVRHVIVVTSPLHTRRSCATFERVGFIVTCIPAREHGASAGAPASSRDRLEAFRQFLYELLGLIEYRLRGWI
jgi:uncharacterized SAM-binding protein YcdF (DUF218 family)